MSETTISQLPDPSGFSADAFTDVLRNGARKLIEQAIHAELATLMAAFSKEKLEDGRARLVRHGHLPERKVMTGIGPVPVKVPRVRDRKPGEDKITFTPSILPRYLRKAKSVEELLPWLYLKGVSTGDFSEALAALLGPNAHGLSAKTITRLKADWWNDYEAWQRRDLSHRRFLYIWADGVYFKPRMAEERQCVLVIVGADEYGHKELLAMIDGFRESAESWRELLLDLRRRGLKQDPKLAIGDGALGFWTALREFAEEGRRSYGRLIPARAAGVRQMVVKDPVGPVAAFTPWNFPIGQAVRKLSAALCTGCSIVLKGAENTPASVMELVRAYLDAGVPPEVISLLSGHPALISERLIAHPAIRKVSFTGSTAVGKELAALAGRHMKRATMELGGHAPVLIFDDADLDSAVERMAAAKFRNAGQICIAPTRFMVQAPLFEAAARGLAEQAQAMRLGDGMDPDTTMGPLAHPRRVEAMETLVQDALDHGARLLTGGKRHGNSGNFFQPTVLADVPPKARMMQEEPFGPIIIVNSFAHDNDAVAEANRLPYGLAAYGFTHSAARAERLMTEVESGMVSINHQGLALIETPFGGLRDSGYGHEGGSEALDAYLNTRFLSHLAV